MSEETAPQKFDEDFEKYFSEITNADDGPESPAPAQSDGDENVSDAQDDHGQVQDQDHSETGEPAQGQEGQGGDSETGEQESGAKTEEELEALRKKAHGYDSMLGRLQAEQRARQEERRQLEQMRQQLEQMRGPGQQSARQPQDGGQYARQGQPQQQQAQSQQPLPMAEIPEEIKDEAESFSKDYPDLSPLLRYPGKEGEKLRKLLAEYGPDVAALHGQSVMSNYRLHMSERQMGQRLSQAEAAAQQAREEAMRQIEDDRKAKHYERIASKHQEVQWMNDPQRQQDYANFRHQLNEWVMDRPLREAQHIQQVLAQGTAPDVIAVIDQFKQSMQAAQPAPQSSTNEAGEARARLAQAAAAVPGRSGVPKSGSAPPPRDDFAAAWQEAVKN